MRDVITDPGHIVTDPLYLLGFLLGIMAGLTIAIVWGWRPWQ